MLASVVPSCIAYDPTFAYEPPVITQDRLRRMFVEHEDAYYIALLNENYPLPASAEAGLLKGLYLFREAAGADNRCACNRWAAAPSEKSLHPRSC
ncbi:hypothetical protein [Bordetella genomosp. 9]|uniref:hypothetical protein n=1 Tax=Bordetella genomosp. 9 TaxID=1416803 RepID=UPI001E31B614|nr:hypothetical protein [Bordetella genomosp. 9]